jgi:hypothetical protein
MVVLLLMLFSFTAAFYAQNRDNEVD